MSMIRCEGCSRLIDTDEDMECIIEDENTGSEVILCGACREKYFREEEIVKQE